MKSKLLKSVIYFLVFIGIIHLALVISGNTHLYKGVANTYLKGRTGPTIDELEIFPYRTIQTNYPEEWKKSVFYNRKTIDESSQSYMDSLGSVALVIIKDDSIQFEQYWENYSESTVSHSFSMGKTFISMALGTCIMNDEIDSIQQPIYTILPEYSEGLNRELTPKDLIGMCSGMNFDEDYKNPFGFAAKAFYGEDLPGLIAPYQVVQKPGVYFDYKSGNTQLLAFALEKASGNTISQIIEERIWKKINAEHDAYWILDREDGHEKAFTGVYATARDYSRIGKLYMDGGFWKGNEVINPDYVFSSIRPLSLKNESNEPVQDYGYGWWLTEFKGKKVFYMRGIYGQYMICVPSQHLIITRLGRKRDEIKIGNHNKDLYFYLELAQKLITSEERRSNSE